MACFWTELLRVVEDCPSGDVIVVHSNNNYCGVDGVGIDPIPAEFVTGDDFTIALGGGDLGEVYFTDWDVGLQRYAVAYPGGMVQGAPYSGTMLQGLNSWPCSFFYTLD